MRDCESSITVKNLVNSLQNNIVDIFSLMIPVASQPVSDLLHPRILQVYLISSLDLALVNIQLSAENVDVCAGHPVFSHLKQILCTSQLPLTPYLARGDR